MSNGSQAATDALCAIFSRTNVDTGSLEVIIEPLFSNESLQLLHDAYLWASEAAAHEDEKYTFVKKLSEVRWTAASFRLTTAAPHISRCMG